MLLPHAGARTPTRLELVKEVEKLAAKKGCTAAQLALAGVLTRGDHVEAA